MRNPCLSCPLEGYDKNTATCRDCNDRVKYVRSIGGMTHSVPIEMSKDGNGTNGDQMRDTMDKLKQAEIYLQETCEKNFITIEDLKSRRFAAGLGDIKREVIRILDKEHNLSTGEIGALLGKTAEAIRVVLNPGPKKTAKSVDNTTMDQKAMSPPLSRTSKGDLGVKVEDCPGYVAERPDHVLTTEEMPKHTGSTKAPETKNDEFIYLIFADYPDLYDPFIKIAKKNFRTPEEHLMYLVNSEVNPHKVAASSDESYFTDNGDSDEK